MLVYMIQSDMDARETFPDEGLRAVCQAAGPEIFQVLLKFLVMAD
jgi:hypothetical protein